MRYTDEDYNRATRARIYHNTIRAFLTPYELGMLAHITHGYLLQAEQIDSVLTWDRELLASIEDRYTPTRAAHR